MTNRTKSIFLVFSLLGLLGNDSFAIADQDGPKIGDVPPPLNVTKSIQGPPVTELNWSALKGKVVVLDFWATWCVPCIQSIPHVNELAEQFKDKPVVFISVTSESEEVVRLFLKKHPFKTCIGLDDDGVLNKAFHVQGIPHTVIVDATGRIAAIAHPGKVRARHLDEVLAGKKCSLPEPTVSTVSNSFDDVVPNRGPALFEISIREKMSGKIQGPICLWPEYTDGCSFEGKNATVESALQRVFDKASSRVFIQCELPSGYYDFVLRAPAGRSNELQNQFVAALRTTFGLDVKKSTKDMGVFVLTQVATNAPKFRKVDKSGAGGERQGGFEVDGASMKAVVFFLEEALQKPVFDETGLDGLFYVDMEWKLSEAEKLYTTTDIKVWEAIEANPDGDWISDLPSELKEGEALENARRLKAELAKPQSKQFTPDPDAVVAAARERLGLQLTLVQRPVEILEVTKASQ